MVDRVVGIADEFELIFERAEGDCWTAVTPANVFGEYVMEIWAYDTAGNASYMATMLYLVSKHTMQAYLIPFEYSGLLDDTALIAKLDEYGLEAVITELQELVGGAEGGNTENQI